MELFVSLKKLAKRIHQIDKRAKYMSEKKCYSSNPFAFVQNKTYVWVERVKDFNKCGFIRKKKND